MRTKVKEKLEVRKGAKKTESPISLDGIRGYLQKGDIEAAAKEAGISAVWASRCMNGKATHWAFTENIVRRAERNRAIADRAEQVQKP